MNVQVIFFWQIIFTITFQLFLNAEVTGDVSKYNRSRNLNDIVDTISDNDNIENADIRLDNFCQIGQVPWNMNAIRNELDLFHEAYDERPIERNMGGTNLFHAFSIWCLVRFIKPKFIIESGGFRGWGTYLLRKAAGSDTHIIVITPSSPSKVGGQFYIDKISSTYLTDEKFKDFNKVDWKSIGLDTPEKLASTLIFFDDHQAGYRRLIEAQQAGFTHIMYDDNYPWPGDNYSLKQTCDNSGYLSYVKKSINLEKVRKSHNTITINFKNRNQLAPYFDNFAKRKQPMDVKKKNCLYQDMKKRVEIYYEFPPLWYGKYRGQDIPMINTILQSPVMNDSKEIHDYINQFKNKKLNAGWEASMYTFFLYVKINRNIEKVTDCGIDL